MAARNAPHLCATTLQVSGNMERCSGILATLWSQFQQRAYFVAKLSAGLLLAAGAIRLMTRGLRWGLFSQRLVWKLKPYLTRHPLPYDIDRWRLKGIDVDDLDLVARLMKENNSWWTFLAPFFAAHGYTHYAPASDGHETHPDPHDGMPTSRQVHPFARRLYSTNKENKMFLAPCIRGARDEHGRDVVIRIVSGPKCSRELEVLQRLTSPSALQDPRNITIPILEWLQFDGLTFIVMPRWDLGWIHDFGRVAECIHIAEISLAYLDFLHEHRIAHMDIHDGNMLINTIVPARRFHLTGLRDPAETRYAMIDFGASHIYPYGTPLDTVRITLPRYAWGFHGLNPEDGPFNPFAADVGALGYLLDRRVRVIRHVVPEIVPFTERMRSLSKDSNERPTAREVYLKFQELKSRLTEEQLKAPVTDLSYKGDGYYQKKYTYKSRPQLPKHNWTP
ncbi:hypothetical protein CVT24_001402 [Panaeolus cyanescens]|uniref:Protein kinase domain-containing protein n=1 Tax=Panaeolus cyanescens TaxID=181874 RepID=A0A409W3E5_9AGAR|nr:hypothetical protein CVT24_001402 [Panaeolus cyanescens]